MVTQRHHIDDYRNYDHDYHGCSHVGDWAINPRCCQDLWNSHANISREIFQSISFTLDFDDSESCREYYDNSDDNIGRRHISEWLMGIVLFGGIVLIGGFLYCCWRQGKLTNL